MGSKVFRRCHSSVEILTEKLSVKKSIVIIILVFIIASAFLGYWFISIKEVPKVFFAPFQTAVEQEYRSKYVKEGRKISETDFWNQKIHGISPKEALQQKAKTLYKEYLLLEKEAKNKGKILKSLDFKCVSWQKVEETMSVNRQIIKDAWVTTLNQSDVKEYYQHHLENFTEQAMIKGKISFWKNGTEIWSEELEISSQNIRNTTELYPELEEKLEAIQKNEQYNWQKDNGYYNFLCLERTEGKVLEFDDVVEAVASQLIDERIDVWLAKERE
ncbi:MULTISPECIES: hypothetical protein [Streptococcus]|nr:MULTISPECIES: hypothetical protein [Streptococcus]MDY5246283.1 hypothetical protein [Ligilactobacillus salivarius]MCO7183545.1 hypothetical protein [Streptococcus gallolyticus]MDV5135513.1 hypothetical protein [Streptococcus pasteurianus]MDV5151778.1 hypothetical protein [Streptococcus pasteurianus]MDV5158002.1 hypothetical protein [Streptococcus pasteurianus]